MKSPSGRRYWDKANNTPSAGRFSGHGPYPHDGVSIPSSWPGVALNHNLVIGGPMPLVTRQPMASIRHGWEDDLTAYMEAA